MFKNKKVGDEVICGLKKSSRRFLGRVISVFQDSLFVEIEGRIRNFWRFDGHDVSTGENFLLLQ